MALLTIALAPLIFSGCGNTNSRRATEQLLMSDAVDRSVASIDFSALRGKHVYLDTRFLTRVKGLDFVNSDYITSALRQQLFAAHCLVEDSLDDAEYVVEARIGALGTDSHDLVFGMPASNLVTTATTFMPNSPPLPTLPEISFARRDEQTGAAKIAVFAYHRETRQPVWQSGISQARGRARDTWVFGAGPFQTGTIYDGAQLAGSRLGLKRLFSQSEEDENLAHITPYSKEVRFRELEFEEVEIPDSAVELANHEEEVQPDGKEEPSKADQKADNPSKDAAPTKTKQEKPDEVKPQKLPDAE